MDWVEWRWRRIDEFDPRSLYRMLALRQRVFVVEQRCVYLDADGLDVDTLHLTAHDGDALAGCLRLMPPGVRGPEAAIGRIVVAPRWRGHGLAREMVRRALARSREEFGPSAVRLAAQSHLVPFYASMGFDAVSSPYDDDGIEHVDMRREHD